MPSLAGLKKKKHWDDSFRTRPVEWEGLYRDETGDSIAQELHEQVTDLLVAITKIPRDASKPEGADNPIEYTKMFKKHV